MACKHDEERWYKGKFLACYCKILKAGKIIAVDKDRVNEICPMKKNASIETNRTN